MPASRSGEAVSIWSHRIWTVLEAMELDRPLRGKRRKGPWQPAFVRWSGGVSRKVGGRCGAGGRTVGFGEMCVVGGPRKSRFSGMCGG